MTSHEELTAWINAVRTSGEYRSIHRWTQAAGIPHQTIGRFLNGESRTISKKNLDKLAAVTAVPLEGEKPHQSGSGAASCDPRGDGPTTTAPAQYTRKW